jgi:sulfite exporter TauE/SafE/copper chaperone CopZ
MGKRIKTKKYYVQGMHCSACEMLIEKRLGKLSGITSAKASLSDKTVTVQATRGTRISLDEYNAKLEELGYHLSTEPVGRVEWDQESVLKATTVLVVLGALLMYARLNGFNAYVSVSETSSYPTFFIFGLVAGLSSCAALVGGLLLSLSKQWNNLYGGNSMAQRSVPFALFNIGRLISYAVLGGLLGVIGGALQLSIDATAWLVLVVSIVMIVIGLQMLGVSWATKFRLQLPSSMSRSMSTATNFQGKYMPFLAGAGTFFLPCGFTLLVQTIALTSGSFVISAMIMFFFALGTFIPLAIISISSMKFQSNPAFAGTFNLIVGILIVAFGAYNINSQLVVLGLPNMATLRSSNFVAGSATDTAIDADGLGVEVVRNGSLTRQNVYMKAIGFDYYPSSLTLQSGIPTTLTIKNEQVLGCAQAMYLKGLHDDIVYLNQPTAQVSFTPNPGKYYISCSMGMVQPVVVNVL